jgi:hypothetical protein
VFSLLIYSCVTVNFPLSGDLMQRTCRWEGGGTLYASHERCLRASPALGFPIFSDVADGRKVEAIKCAEQSVVE